MFLDPSDFPFTTNLEAHWEIIRDEYLALSPESFDPWVQQQMHGEGWSVYGLFALGQRIPGACAACPKTAQIIEAIPGVSLAGFSRMAPGTHITPHVGWAESVYRLHLGLVIPPDCGICVADETRHWEPGKCLIFDDTKLHEAWNDSDQFRGILMLDFLRPGITDFTADMVPNEVRRYAEGLMKGSMKSQFACQPPTNIR